MIQEIGVRELSDRRAAGSAVYLIDVRQPWERATAALPCSILIPLHELPTRMAEVRPPAGALVVVYCHHGIRSLAAAAFLEAQGFGPVLSLAGGIDAWSVEVDPTVPRY